MTFLCWRHLRAIYAGHLAALGRERNGKCTGKNSLNAATWKTKKRSWESHIRVYLTLEKMSAQIWIQISYFPTAEQNS